MARLGTISQTVNSMVEPAKMVGSMDTTSPNLINAARKVVPSRKFGFLPSSTMGSTAKRETRLANTGVKLVMEEGMLNNDGSNVKLGDEVGYDRDYFLIVESDTQQQSCGDEKREKH